MGGGVILPNVSYIVETNGVEYNPINPNVFIKYAASAKLIETTSQYNNGLHTNAFNTTIKSHTFENGVGTIEFNDDVTNIGEYAFTGCYGLTSVTIPNSVTTIGSAVFNACRGLTSVTIPNTVTSIGNNAFYGCRGLKSITIGNGITRISEKTFYNCNSLTSITIGSGVTSIDDRVFETCTSLISITSLATTAPTIQSGTLYGVKSNGTLYVPSGSTGYDVWMGTGNYYLGKYNWTKVEQ